MNALVLKLSLKPSTIEYYNVTKDQTYFSLPYSMFVNKTDQLNVSVCFEFDKTICSQPIPIQIGKSE